MRHQADLFQAREARQLIAGIDEVGRGPLAGPVVTAAVILNDARPITGLVDSKKLTARERNTLATDIKKYALSWSIAWADAAEIDCLNILQATMLAMNRVDDWRGGRCSASAGSRVKQEYWLTALAPRST